MADPAQGSWFQWASHAVLPEWQRRPLTWDVSERSGVNAAQVLGEILHVSEYPRAADRLRECPLLFFEGSIFASLLGVVSHIVYGAVTKKDVKAVSSFAMMLMGTYFWISWLAMTVDGAFPPSLTSAEGKGADPTPHVEQSR